MQKNDVIGGGIFIILGIFIFVTVLGYPVLEDNHPGPGLFPQILSVLFIIFGGRVCYQGIKTKKADAAAKGTITWLDFIDPGIVLLLITGYMVFSDWLGFFITSFVILLLMMLRLKVALWKSAVVAIVLTLFVHFMFAKLLRVPLPPGLFSL